VLYTDGVIEHKRDIIDGETRLLEAARLAVSEDNPALAIQQRIFAGGAPADDVAILTVRFKEAADGTPAITVLGGLQLSQVEVQVRDSRSEPAPGSKMESGREPVDDVDVILRELLRSRSVRVTPPA
jgi:Stage II sporulation protein E (SpoIIE)